MSGGNMNETSQGGGQGVAYPGGLCHGTDNQDTVLHRWLHNYLLRAAGVAMGYVCFEYRKHGSGRRRNGLVSVFSGIIPRGISSFVAGVGGADAVLLQFAVERGLANAQQARGQELIAIQLAQGFQDGIFL